MRLSLPQAGIIVSGLTTAMLHFVAAAYLFDPPDPLFTLNGLGYLGLLAAYFLRVPLLQRTHRLIGWALAAYALLTILLWIGMGSKEFTNAEGVIGYSAKLAELALLGCLWLDRPGSSPNR